MADAKITELTELAAASADDLLVIVDAPSGTPVTKKVVVSNFLGNIPSSLVSDTDSTDDLGSSSKYWANGYFDKVYLNSTATLDGSSAGLITATGDVKVIGSGSTSATSALKIFKSDGTSWIANFRNNNTVAINAENDPDGWAILYVNGGFRCDDDWRFKKGSGAQYVTRIGGSGYDIVFQCQSDQISLFGAGGMKLHQDVEMDGALNHDGSTVGFYGVTPISRAVLATGAGATVDNVITALQNLGLVSQS